MALQATPIPLKFPPQLRPEPYPALLRLKELHSTQHSGVGIQMWGSPI